MASELSFTPPNQPQLAGSVFVNNTTYAGCDIKIVVHLYDAAKNAENRVKRLQEDLGRLQTRLIAATSELTAIKSRLTAARLGTNEFRILQSRQGRLERERAVLQMSINTTNEQMATAAKDTSVATKTLAEAQTLSLSVYRDKQAVRSCGTVYPRGFTRGPREIAGSLVFTVFHEHVLHQLIQTEPGDFDANHVSTAVIDQLPPVDITISFANEYGKISRMGIYGVEFLSEGQTMSVEDLITENVVNFVARDYDPMRSVSERKLDAESNQLTSELGVSASNLLLEEDYQAIKDQLSPFERSRRRRNPFL